MNAYEQVWKSITGMPATNLAEKQYHAVKLDTAGKITTAGEGEKVLGVLYEPNNVGEPAQVVASGMAFCVLGGTVATGDELQANADGKFIKLASGKSAGICMVGGNANQVGTIFLR